MKHILAYLILFLLLIISCKDSDNPVGTNEIGDSDNIVTGEVIDISTQSVGTGGGTLIVNKPGDPLDKMEIIVQSNSFSNTKTFKISRAEIKEHKLGSYFHPISQMIKVAYEGGFSEKIIRIKIPIKLPQNHFAMGFFYDKSTGEVEGLPIESLSDSSITICTRHFTSNSAQRTGKINKIGNVEIIGEIIISSIDESVLNSTGTIESGFAPGYDDWEFINMGSYIASGGHCAGQAITAIWYYIEKAKKGASKLNGRFDTYNDANKPIKLWQDNPRGYRFASTIQADMKFDSWVDDLNFQFNRPDLTIKAFALSMLETKQPQLVCIRKSTTPYDGHAMIVYKIDYKNGKLFIADPNYPNNRTPDENGTLTNRIIEFKNNKFEPYLSSLNAATPGINFDQIGYFAKTAFINWEQINARWLEFEWGTIGQDRFPAYTLHLDNTSGHTLIDTLSYDKDTLTLVCKSTESGGSFNGTDHLQWIEVYDDEGNKIADTDTLTGILKIKLKPGINKLGICIWCRVAPNGRWPYVDFKWITVTTKPTLKIEPDPLKGEPNVSHTFMAYSGGIAPEDAKYVWNFGDDTPEVIKINDSSVTHVFTQEGYYVVQVTLYDNKTNQFISTALGSADIFYTDLTELISCKNMYIHLECKFIWLPEPCLSCGNDMLFINSADTIPSMQIKWDGTSFSLNYNYINVSPYLDTVYYTGNISGSVSSDAKKILKITAYQTYWSPPDYEIKQELELTNVPIEEHTIDIEKFLHTSYTTEVAHYVSRVKYTIRRYDSAAQQWKVSEATSVNWQESDYNSLYLRFSK